MHRRRNNQWRQPLNKLKKRETDRRGGGEGVGRKFVNEGVSDYSETGERGRRNDNISWCYMGVRENGPERGLIMIRGREEESGKKKETSG